MACYSSTLDNLVFLDNSVLVSNTTMAVFFSIETVIGSLTQLRLLSYWQLTPMV